MTAAAAALLLVLSACSDETADPPHETIPDTEAPLAPAFAIASSVFGDQDAATYVSVLGSLDAPSIDIAKASEHAGFATIAARGGKLFVGDGISPVVTRYLVDDRGTLAKEASFSFGPKGVQSAPLYFNTFVGAEKAYLQHEQNKRVFWNPATMELEGAPAVAVEGLDTDRDGLHVISAYDRGIAVRDGYVFHPYYWTDDNYFAFAPTSQIAVFDADDLSLVELLDAPCPGLDFVTSDEEGNLYFSNWVFAAAGPVLDEDAPPTCAVRIDKGTRTINEGWTRDLNELVEGRQTAAFRYLGANVGILAAFDADRLEITEATKPSDVTSGNHWRLWQVNLSTGESAPIQIQGAEWIAGGYYAFEIDSRIFLLLPSADYAKTTVYELGADDVATKLFETPGWAYQFVKIR